ncbi:hypothetical protein GCM10007860_25240 [Chitiniphilus shinanonensis]|uniref:DUF2502 domain-containing protein n=1 Tax=Chitiniphilus shinanonensis TaxID=553088 RepID=A0ABQ6BVI0_9NEIS|nr:DUF2502 domain-containing protein [Chitiniphilus shinanonensis]GLS05372.1 hypothetical protein GCM10007860_25240 [Chitiniphilus shinanonensis]
MKKYLLIAALAALPLLGQAADVDVSIGAPGISIHIGDRDHRGYYWDGYDWREPRWWDDHQGRHVGERHPKGYYWDGHRWRDQKWWHDHHGPKPKHCPPGQAKKGRC